MTDAPLTDDRIRLGASEVSAMVAARFPQWANLPVVAVEPGGWDNLTFRLGATMSVRLPSAWRYVAQIAREHRWLPVLAGELPLPIPEPLAMGTPTIACPWPWSIHRWIEGEPASTARIADMPGFARDLAGFLRALQRIDATSGPAAGAHNFFRGGPLSVYDAEARAALARVADELDASAVLATWEAAVASAWQRPPVWVHGDVASGNLLVRDGRLHAVIDFGSCGTGDPACDLAIAWAFMDAESRAVFRRALAPDDATWMRGRGWALWKALIVLAEHGRASIPGAWARRTIGEVLEDR